MERAHRVVWKLVHGDIPDGLFVLHCCDNRLCVNPSHLWVGTQGDNMRDAAQKHRLYRPSPETHLRGTQQMQAKLQDGQVRAIRHLCLAGVSQREISQRFHVCQTTVSTIHRGTAWRHIE